jgi:hypothetical protein
MIWKSGIRMHSLAHVLLWIGCYGCASYRQVLWNDFRDTFKLSVGVGLGVHADIKATSVLHGGVGWFGLWWNAGLRDRHTPFVFPTQEMALFPLYLSAPLWEEKRKWYLSETLRLANGRLTGRYDGEEPFITGSLFDVAGFEQWQAYGPRKLTEHPTMFKGHVETAYTEKPCGLECGLGLFVLNARLGIDPVEFVDLWCTAFGWDMLGDNPNSEEPANTRVEASRTSRAPEP